MLFTIKKNTEQNCWDVFPNSGRFAGFKVASAEGIDLTSVTTNADKVIGTIKAVWGLQIVNDIDVYSDVETIRALCLGRAFKGEAEHPVSWMADGIYDHDSHRLLRQCRRLVILGSSIFRRG